MEKLEGINWIKATTRLMFHTIILKMSRPLCHLRGRANTSGSVLAEQAVPAAPAAQMSDMPAEYKQVLDTLGKQGDFKDGVLKVNIPRSDLKVTVDGVATPTPFGFGGWVALEKGTGGMEVMMGDLVLTESEVNPVMSALLDNGLEVTALHNHFFFEPAHLLHARARSRRSVRAGRQTEAGTGAHRQESAACRRTRESDRRHAGHGATREDRRHAWRIKRRRLQNHDRAA